MLTVLLQNCCLRVYIAIFELDKSLGSADVIFFADLARVKKTSAQQAIWIPAALPIRLRQDY